jgi:hypothetical protein
MVVVSAVGVSTAVAFVVAGLGAQSATAGVESALVERTSPVAFRILMAEDPGSLHLPVHHPGSLSIVDDLTDP